METIYIDVLIILNIYVNCFLLRITAKITGTPLKTARCIVAGAYGSLFSLLILIPELPIIINIIIKSFAAITIVAAAFGFHGKKRFFKNSAAFFTSNFILAGAVYAVYSWLKPTFIHFSNSYFYIDFSLLLLVISTAVLYFIVCIFRRFSDKIPDDGYYVIIKVCGQIYKIDGISDTGNSLTDLFSGRPVVICERELFGEIEKKLPSVRILPVNTVSGNGFMSVFRPDELLVVNNVSGERKAVDVMVGIGETEGKAIFNPKILKY